MQHLLERFGGFFPAVLALLVPIVFIPTLSDLFILPRASIVIAGACIGTGLALLMPARGALGALRWPLLAASAAALLAFAFSVSWPLSLAGSYTRYESLPMRLSYLGLLASAVWLLRTRLQREALVVAFVFASSIAALEAIQQASAHVAFRPDGNLGNANLLAALLVMAIPMAIERSMHATSRSIAAWSAASVVMAGGLVVTTSRSGYLGAVVGGAVLLAFVVPRRLSLPVGVASAVFSSLVLAFFAFSPLRALNGDPPELRLHLWADGLRMVTARPITGWGEDATGLAFGHFLSQDYAGLVTFDRVHSGPLDVAATQGLLGLAATGVVVALILVRSWKHRSQPGVAGLAAALAGYSVWVAFNFDWSPATGPFWLLAGALWSASKAPLPSGEKERERGEGRTWQAVLAVLFVVAAIPFAALPIVADSWYVKGRADLAVQADPLQAQYHWAIGTLSELRQAAGLGETDPGLYVVLGDAEQRAGNRTAAIRAYERALEIDPWYDPAYQRLKTLGLR